MSGWPSVHTPSVVARILKAVLGPPPALAALDGARQEGELEAGLCRSLPPLHWWGLVAVLLEIETQC